MNVRRCLTRFMKNWSGIMVITLRVYAAGVLIDIGNPSILSFFLGI